MQTPGGTNRLCTVFDTILTQGSKRTEGAQEKGQPQVFGSCWRGCVLAKRGSPWRSCKQGLQGEARRGKMAGVASHHVLCFVSKLWGRRYQLKAVLNWALTLDMQSIWLWVCIQSLGSCSEIIQLVPTNVPVFQLSNTLMEARAALFFFQWETTGVHSRPLWGMAALISPPSWLALLHTCTYQHVGSAHSSVPCLCKAPAASSCSDNC